MIREQAGTEFDPTVVEAFLHVIETRGGIEGLAILKRDFSFFPRQIIDAGWRSASHVKGTLS
jgi:hypothetical protein